jgi:glyoxylate/succinic semialdehyde reductase
MATRRVGFLGLGVMGKQMAKQLLRSNIEVVVWNRSMDKTNELVEDLGATAMGSPAEVVAASDVTHAMLSDPAASEAVVLGPDGVLAAMEPGRSFIDHTTTSEHSSTKLQAAIGAKGGRFLAAPVSGGWRDAAKGELLFIAGGDRSLFDESSAAGGGMAAMGHKHWHVGGSPVEATRAKCMLQIMMGSMIGALGETMALSEKAGLDPEMIMDMFNNSAMGNSISKAKGQLMIERDYAPNFQIYLQQKDLRLALALADQLGMPAPIAAAVNAQYVAARQKGLSAADFAAVRSVYDP